MEVLLPLIFAAAAIGVGANPETSSPPQQEPPEAFVVWQGGSEYNCERTSVNDDSIFLRGNRGSSKGGTSAFPGFVGHGTSPSSYSGHMCYETLRCKFIQGGECSTERLCKQKGPGYKWIKSFCGRKSRLETLKAIHAIVAPNDDPPESSLGHTNFGAIHKGCGCCVPPGNNGETEEDTPCKWGCAPADYTTCPCAPPGEAACEAQEDHTGDKVCAWEESLGTCVGCTGVSGDKTACEAHANCEYNNNDGKCVAKGRTTSPATDFYGNSCN